MVNYNIFLQIFHAVALGISINTVFSDEYGIAVTAELKNCIALSESGEERMEGIVVRSNECTQMGILVHVTRRGRKLNIKLYSLFMPIGNTLAEQKQQALSLYNKFSPSVNGWESRMKDTILMAIQQILNSASQSTSTARNFSENRNEPIF